MEPFATANEQPSTARKEPKSIVRFSQESIGDAFVTMCCGLHKNERARQMHDKSSRQEPVFRFPAGSTANRPRQGGLPLLHAASSWFRVFPSHTALALTAAAAPLPSICKRLQKLSIGGFLSKGQKYHRQATA
ncbi:hypothetical protein [Aquamicrobium terrae]